jgi:hypothetical protein
MAKVGHAQPPGVLLRIQLLLLLNTYSCCHSAGVSKLSDANDAGTRNSHMCTLILTEGDSAKSLAMSGLSVVGHDHWGVFPLRCTSCGTSTDNDHSSGHASAIGHELLCHQLCHQ